MWFRIEQNKDGSIATCTAVEGSLGNRGAVHYIEADTAESACKILLARYTKIRADQKRSHDARMTAKKQAGICTRCGGLVESLRLGLSLCAGCNAKKTERDRLMRAGLVAPARQYATTDAERISRVIHGREAQRIAFKCKADTTSKAKRCLLQRCLEAFDRMTPRLFREWLAEELHKAREAEQASAQRRAARITKAA